MKELKKVICTKLSEEIHFLNGKLIINQFEYLKTWKVELYGVEDLSLLDNMFFESKVEEFEFICANGETLVGNIIVKTIKNDMAELLGDGPLNLK